MPIDHEDLEQLDERYVRECDCAERRQNIALREAMRRLSDREKHILSLRFYDGKTQMEVANQVGISQAQVSRLEKNAINQIRKAITVS